MADVKKPAGKPAPKPAPSSSSFEHELEYVFFAAIIAVIIFVIIPAVVKFFGYGDVKYSVPSDIGTQASNAFNSFVETVSAISIFISLLIGMALVYAKIQYKEVTTAYKALQDRKGESPDVAGRPVYTSTPVGAMNLPGATNAIGDANTQGQSQIQQAPTPDPRWLDIEKHMQANSQSEWRVAILEADILLNDMLEQMGYPGDSVGEMLKAADESTFTTLQEAWKAHRIRNIIAHEGAGYELSREEAERAIRLFKKVFEEFYFI